MGCLKLHNFHSDSKLLSDYAPKLEVVRDFLHVAKLEVAYKKEVLNSNIKNYPYGMLMPGRHGEAGNANYTYGFQGSEKDDEVKGEGNSYTTYFRQLDPRLGKWLTIDPKANQRVSNSPYLSMGNNPILRTDPFGDLDDDYGIDKNGAVVLLEKNDKPDRLYEIDNAKSSKPKKVSEKYANAPDGVLDKLVNRKTFLTFSPSGKYQTKDIFMQPSGKFPKSEDGEAMSKLYFFIANRAMVEYILVKYKDSDGKTIFSIASALETQSAVSYSRIIGEGLSKEDVILAIHNHPNEEAYNTYEGRSNSTMGDLGRELAQGGFPFKNYVFFPGQKEVWEIKPYKKAKIHKIKTKKSMVNLTK